MKACSDLGVKQVFTSWSNPKDNAGSERVIKTLKKELVWRYDQDHPFNFQRALENGSINITSASRIRLMLSEPLVNIM